LRGRPVAWSISGLASRTGASVWKPPVASGESSSERCVQPFLPPSRSLIALVQPDTMRRPTIVESVAAASGQMSNGDESVDATTSRTTRSSSTTIRTRMSWIGSPATTTRPLCSVRVCDLVSVIRASMS
jgi:hypothetical protein